MKNKTIFYLVIVGIIVIGSALIGLVSYNNSINNINISEVKSVKFFPFRGAIPKKEYTYNTGNADDTRIVNNIISYINSGKIVGTKRLTVSQGGSPEALILELNSGQDIEITIRDAGIGQVLITKDSRNMALKLYSPELRKLFTDEFKRIFSS